MSLGAGFIFAEDNALKTLLQGITVSDLANANRPLKVYYGYPDIELRTQEYPYAVLELYDIREANDRQSSGYWVDDTNRGTVTADGQTTYNYYAPVVYDLFYQVTTYSRHPRHDRSIIYYILNEKIPGKYGHLLIPDANGDGGVVARHMFLEGFVKRDRVEDGRRVFQNVFSIRVMSEMTPLQVSAFSKPVQKVNLTNNGDLPSGQTSIQSTKFISTTGA
jgi:hypothetical protein